MKCRVSWQDHLTWSGIKEVWFKAHGDHDLPSHLPSQSLLSNLLSLLKEENDPLWGLKSF